MAKTSGYEPVVNHTEWKYIAGNSLLLWRDLPAKKCTTKFQCVCYPIGPDWLCGRDPGDFQWLIPAHTDNSPCPQNDP
jgi:hypothetical protein